MGHLFLYRSTLFEGLVIDDFYSVSIERAGSPPEESRSVQHLEAAAGAYAKYELLGSAEKDVRGASSAKVAGIEIDSSPPTRALGLVPAGAPRSKRLSLASLSLSIASLPCATDCLLACLVGGWTSAFVYRRPAMAILAEVFRVSRADQLDPSDPKVVPLPRPAADELALCAALAPLAVADLAAPWDPTVYATDSSDSRAAIVKAPLSTDTAALLWHASDRKGASTRLLSRAQACLKKADLYFEELPEDDAWGEGFPLDRARLPDSFSPPCPRPVGFRFHFLQIGSVSTYVLDRLAAEGWCVGPCLHTASSAHYDLCCEEFFLWVLHLLEAGKVDSMLVSLPSSTFSAAAQPPFRTYRAPFGDPSSPKVARENQLLQRALALCEWARQRGLLSMLAIPGTTLASALPAWASLSRKGEVTELKLKSDGRLLNVLSVRLPVHRLSRGPSGYDAAPGHPELESFLPWAGVTTEVFSQGLRRLTQARERVDLDSFGLESPWVNDLALGLSWALVSAWDWRRERHINVHETGAFKRLCVVKARGSIPSRFSSLIDSNVARCAISKGRSPSSALTAELRQISALSLAFGLYGALPFAPTRLMPADAPSRSAPIPPPVPGPLLHERLPDDGLASLPRLRRWSSNWVRLVLRTLPWAPPEPSDRCASRPALLYRPPLLDFDSSLGFPREGPSLPILFRVFGVLFLFGAGVVGAPPCRHGPLEPRNARDVTRSLGHFQKEGPWRRRHSLLGTRFGKAS